MERHYLHGIVNEEFKRPDRKLVQEFAKLSVASVSGAMHGMGLMHWEIKPISRKSRRRCCGGGRKRRERSFGYWRKNRILYVG